MTETSAKGKFEKPSEFQAALLFQVMESRLPKSAAPKYFCKGMSIYPVLMVVRVC
jgi:hypothetical protein